ncbi:MAG: hypothetical protein ACREMY_00865 [bacterium]
MGFREEIQRRIEKKQAEWSELERELDRQRAAAEAYVQALQDMLKVLPRDVNEVKPETYLRPGGAMARTRELILAQGHPLHVNDILKGLGKPTERGVRTSLSTSLNVYARKGEVFVRTGPSTFGLLELGHSSAAEAEPPAGFGRLATAEAENDEMPR